MEKFIPYEKLSRKEQKKINAKKRSEWTMKPVERVKQSAKVYNRAKQKARRAESADSGSFYLPNYYTNSNILL